MIFLIELTQPKANMVHPDTLTEWSYYEGITRVDRLLRSMGFMVQSFQSSLMIFESYLLADECQQKYGSATVWKACCSVFDYLNLAAVCLLLLSLVSRGLLMTITF